MGRRQRCVMEHLWRYWVIEGKGVMLMELHELFDKELGGEIVERYITW